MSWVSQWVRLAAVFVVWPLALRQYSLPEVLLWQVFNIVFLLQSLADFGLSSVISRYAAAARFAPVPGGISGGTAESRLAELRSASERLYRRVAWCGGAVLLPVTAVIGVRVPELSVAGSGTTILGGWCAWAATAIAFVVNLRTGVWGAILQGDGRLVRFRRVEALVGGLSTLMIVVGLIFVGGLLPMALANLLASLALAVWCRRTLGRKSGESGGGLVAEIWSQAWRAGVGMLSTSGVAQVAALVVAMHASSGEAATYLLAWRVISILSQLSQPPFYARLPEFGALAAAGSRDKLLRNARIAIGRSLGLFSAGYVVLGFVGPELLQILGAQVDWASPTLWVLFGVTIFLERYGAMQLQLDTLGHTVRWHIANGVAGLIAVSAMLLTRETLGVLAVPAGLLLGNVAFYCPYARHLSKKRFGWTWRSFDWPATLFLVVVLIASGVLL